MAAPQKPIPDNIGRRIRQLYDPRNVGYRRVADIIANEFGPDFRYSHTHIKKYLKSGNQIPNIPVDPEPTPEPSGPIYLPPNPPARRSSIAAWQLPDIYVSSITPSAQPQSTMILPYPIEEPARDSWQQVMFDLARAKGYAMINQQHQPQPQSQPSTTAPEPERSKPPTPSVQSSGTNKPMDKFMEDLEAIKRTLQKQAQEREEERSKTLKEIQDGIDELRRKQESKQTEPGTTTDKTDFTIIQEQNDLKTGKLRSPADISTGAAVTVPPGASPPPVVTLNTPGANIQPDPSPKPSPTATPQPPSLQDAKPESPEDIDSNKQKPESTVLQTPDNQQDSTVTLVTTDQTNSGTATEQSPVVRAQSPIANQLGLPILPPENPGSKTPMKPAHSGDTSSLVINSEKSLDVGIQQEPAKCVPSNALSTAIPN